MKKALLTFAVVLLAVAAQAQSAISFKIHDTGRVSIQSGTTNGGVQFYNTGFTSFEPNLASSYDRILQCKVGNTMSKCWIVRNDLGVVPGGDMFYVMGNGSCYSYHQYTIGIVPSARALSPIENASEMLRDMKGYYYDSDEFAVDPDELYGNENVIPEAIDGLLKDAEKTRSVGMQAEEIEEILPEAVRHTCEGQASINYNALVPVLIEAFKEQQARIDELETILRNNGLLEK